MKTYITALVLIAATVILCAFNVISVEFAWAIIAYMVIQLPKRHTQKRIETASKYPDIYIKSASRFVR